MPIQRNLEPSDPSSAWGPPHLPSAATVAVVGLGIAFALAIGATVLPIARIPLIVFATVIAIPSVTVAFRRTRSMPGGDRDLRALGLDASLTDPLTGAGNAAALDAALDAAVLDPSTLPLTLLRLALVPARCDETGASPTVFRLASGADAPTDAPTEAPASDRDQERSLVLAAVRWLEIMRPGDLLVRAEAGEFAVVLPRCDARAARAVITRLCAAVPNDVLVAVGVASWDGEETVGALRRRADLALDAERSTLADDPITDPARVAAVTATGLTRGHIVAEFDEIAAGVAWLLRTPIVVITLFDASWQHFIGQAGVVDAGGPGEGTPAREAICRQTVASGRPLVVSDTARHASLRDVPATRDLGVKACASVPITTADGLVLGSVCSMVLERHSWSAEDVALLKLTAARVSERLAEAPARSLSVA